MSPAKDYSPHQRRVIRDYYRNQGAIQSQALSDLVSDLWLATTPAKKAALWAKAAKILAGLGVPASRAEAVVSAQDVTALAALAEQAFGEERKQGWARDAREDRAKE